MYSPGCSGIYSVDRGRFGFLVCFSPSPFSSKFLTDPHLNIVLCLMWVRPDPSCHLSAVFLSSSSLIPHHQRWAAAMLWSDPYSDKEVKRTGTSDLPKSTLSLRN